MIALLLRSFGNVSWSRFDVHRMGHLLIKGGIMKRKKNLSTPVKPKMTKEQLSVFINAVLKKQ